MHPPNHSAPHFRILISFVQNKCASKTLRLPFGAFFAFVVDSTDRDRLPVVKEELFRLLEQQDLKEPKDVFFQRFCNPSNDERGPKNDS